MKFKKWLEIKLQERGARTSISPNYPPLYNSKRQHPVQDWMPTSATAGLAVQNIKNDKMKKKGSPNVLPKKDNPYKSFYNLSENIKIGAMNNAGMVVVYTPEGRYVYGTDPKYHSKWQEDIMKGQDEKVWKEIKALVERRYADVWEAP